MSPHRDPRSDRTRLATHEALLDLLQDTNMRDITVTTVCRRAGISRGTFYRHWADIDTLTDELIDQALDDGAGDAAQNHLAECQRAPVRREYLALFTSPELAGRVVSRIVARNAQAQVDTLRRRTGLGRPQAEALFHYLVMGTLAINRAFRWGELPGWRPVQEATDVFVTGGIEALEHRYGRDRAAADPGTD
ncbi:MULTISPECIES: TetR/AcrR family transcriptional regulator [unclassified Actinomyces]|nr:MULTISPECIES: TetR/AcrR family transcriptional regulator [unclassified Actinomyces]